MSYRVKVRSKASKYLERISTKAHKERIQSFLKALEEDLFPEGYDIKQMEGSNTLYRCKIQPYRVIFSVDEDDDEILVTKIGPRGDAYKGG